MNPEIIKAIGNLGVATLAIIIFGWLLWHGELKEDRDRERIIIALENTGKMMERVASENQDNFDRLYMVALDQKDETNALVNELVSSINNQTSLIVKWHNDEKSGK